MSSSRLKLTERQKILIAAKLREYAECGAIQTKPPIQPPWRQLVLADLHEWGVTSQAESWADVQLYCLFLAEMVLSIPRGE